MEKGCFIISLDFEMAWGRITEPNLSQFFPLLKKTRLIVKKLLAIFEQYQIPVTWAVVGRLLDSLDGKPQKLSAYYKTISTNSIFTNGELNNPSNSFLRGDDLIEMILNSTVKHEIASHSYDHIIFGDDRCDALMAEEDIKRALEAAAKRGIQLSSFVFPKNKVGFLDLFAKHGFRAYRGQDRCWYEKWPSRIQRYIRQLDIIFALTPLTTLPVWNENGLINIPGNMLFRIQHLGLRKYIPPVVLATKAIKGILSAVKEKKVFHLWFHPFNFGYRTKAHFHALEKVLRVATELREAGTLDICTICTTVEKYAKTMQQSSL